MSNDTPLQHLQDVLSSFGVGMLTTVGQNKKIHTRPMAIARREKDGRLWFLTSMDSAKVDEVQMDGRAGVSFQDDTCFVAMNGVMVSHSRRDTIEDLWSDAFLPWFPDGVETPDLAALCFEPKEAEYWDARGAKAVRQVFRSLKAIAQGESVDVREPQEHGHVRFS